MRKFLAPLLASALVVSLAGSAMAEGNILQQLQELSGQAQQETTVGIPTTGFGSDSLLLVPSVDDVQAEVDMEAGDTAPDRLASYVAKLEAAAHAQSPDFDSLVKLGYAYQMQTRHDLAEKILQQAVALEPGAQSVYDALAKSAAAADPGFKVYVEGKRIAFDVDPTIVSGRTLVPIRAVAEQLGAQVSWDPATFTATIVLGPNKVEVTRDSTVAKVNGVAVTLDVPATILNGRTLLPLRFVGENLNEQVDFHSGGLAGSGVISMIDK